MNKVKRKAITLNRLLSPSFSLPFRRPPVRLQPTQQRHLRLPRRGEGNRVLPILLLLLLLLLLGDGRAHDGACRDQHHARVPGRNADKASAHFKDCITHMVIEECFVSDSLTFFAAVTFISSSGNAWDAAAESVPTRTARACDLCATTRDQIKSKMKQFDSLIH